MFPWHKEIIMRPRVSWGHASANQLKSVLVNSDGESMHSAHYAVEALETRDICRASDKAPCIRIAGTSRVSTPNAELQVDPSFSRDTASLCATHASPRYPPSIPVRPKNPKAVWGVFCSSRVAIFGRSERIRMYGGR